MADMYLLNAIGELFDRKFKKKYGLIIWILLNVIRKITKNWKLHIQILMH